MSSEIPLFRAAPTLRQAVPHTALGVFPTPLEPVTLGERTFLVKRDDLCAVGYAGNKLRKLEFLLAEAQEAGARRLVTAGATGSHHAFATAYHAAGLGLPSSLVLFPQRVTPHVSEMLTLMAATGAELRWVRRMEAVPLGLWRARLAHRGDAPAVIPPGGSSATGTLAYVNAALELAEQLPAAPARPSSIHVAAGTLGTAAGLAVGLAWAGERIPVVAVRITSRLVTNERVLGRLVHATLSLLRRGGARVPAAADVLSLVRLEHDHLGTGYGHATEEGERTAAAFQAAGLHLDPTYTAKAAAALLAADHPAGMPLFWHTLSAVTPAELREGAAAVTLPEPFASYVRG
jgi:D-cysteine desulfhydrase